MKLSPNHLKRYKQIARIFWKYGRSDLVRQMGKQDGIDPKELESEGEGKTAPDQLADDLEAMGPTYVKLGQVLSGRPDLLPEPYLKALWLGEVAGFPSARESAARKGSCRWR